MGNPNELRLQSVDDIVAAPPEPDPAHYRADGWKAGRFDYEAHPPDRPGDVARVWVFSPLLRDAQGADIPSSGTEYQLWRNNEYLLPKEEAMELESAVNRRGRVSDLPSDVGLAAVAGKVRLGPAPASGKQWKVPSY